MTLQIVISLVSFFLFLPFTGEAQLISVSGFVKNASTGEVKRNVTVFESGSGIGTITNTEGYYRLLLSPGQQKLEISSPGFQKFTSVFTLKTDTIITAELSLLELTQEKIVTEKEPVPGSYISGSSGTAQAKGHK